MMRYNSPLRYPGGKAKLVDYVKALIRGNGLLDGAYAEPYAGGASVGLALLFEEHVSRIYINDLDPAVYAFWYSVLYHTDDLCRLIRNARLTSREWERQRAIYFRGSNESRLALGFSTFYLNRTNRSGIIASGGMIGGRHQKGKWRLDARYNSGELAARVLKVARYRDRISVSNLDAVDFLAYSATHLPPKSLIYLDPPYYVKGQQKLYANYYTPHDHALIAEVLPAVPFHWIISYDNARPIRDLYAGYRRLTYKLRYTASERQEGSEVIFFSPDLSVPTGICPGELQNARGVGSRSA